MLRAGLAQIDITPPLGVEIAGWLYKKYATQIKDPIFANILILESGATRIGMVSLDVLSVPWKLVDAIRDRAVPVGIPRNNLLVCATHNHAGPAVANIGQTTRDEHYVADLCGRLEYGFGQAAQNMQPSKIATASTLEGGVSFIRRAIMRDGGVQCQPHFSHAIRSLEAVIDPEVGILAIVDMHDRPLGFVVNFACHPTHHGHDGVISAGWPGALYRQIQAALGPSCVTLLLNGALGDVFHRNPLNPEFLDFPDRIGRVLAGHVLQCLGDLKFAPGADLHACTTTVQLPLRDPDGPWGIQQPFPQRFADDDIYAPMIASLRRRRQRQPFAHAQVQCLRFNTETAYVTLPAEAFAAIGLQIKMQSTFANTWVVGMANGMVGYIPTAAAFPRGGYETSLGLTSKCEPASAQLLIGAGLDLLKKCVC
jgi:hypothetical protein